MPFTRYAALILSSLLMAACAASTQTQAASTPLAATGSAAPASATQPAVFTGTDLSSLSYTQAFDSMFETVRSAYAFNGIADKQPEWEALYAEIRPRVAQAETGRDAQAWFLALRDFTLAFKDGRVNLGGGEIQVTLFQSAIAGGYGLSLRELDDGRVLVAYLTPGGPAELAGIRLGSQVTRFNGQPIAAAIQATKIWGAPPSLDSLYRYQKTRYLTRAPLGTQTTIEFINSDGEPQTVTLAAIQERDSFAVSSFFFTYTAESLPVEFNVLPSGLGYIRITSTADNPSLTASLFESALRELSASSVPGLIIDLRVVANLAPDSSLPPLGLASFLARDEILLGQLQFFNASSGRFENGGAPHVVSPRADYFQFPALALLVGPGCSGGCELEAYAFSRLPGMIVVGQHPTAGALSDLTGGQFLLPENFLLQIPMGRYSLPDGGLFIEGRGVQPTVRVPVDETTVLSPQDVVLLAAQEILLK